MVEGNALLLGDALKEKGFAVTQPQASIVPSAAFFAAPASQGGAQSPLGVAAACFSRQRDNGVAHVICFANNF